MAEASAAGSSPPPLVVRVRRELLAACMTCPLCHKLLREATTISECLHTFCRKCIFEKLTDEEVDCCPICNKNLGCAPVEKLRPDHNLQDIRSKIFPFKRRKVNAPEVPSILLPVRRKERSLSSLVVNTPRVASQSGLTGRRTKAARRVAALRGPSPANNESPKKEDNVKDQADNSNSETLSKMTKSRRLEKNNLDAEPSDQTLNRDRENGVASFVDKAELWKPLNCLVEAANRTKAALRSSPQSSVVKAEQINGAENEVHIPKTNFREHPNKLKVQDDNNGINPAPPISAKAKRLQGISRRKRELGSSTQAPIDAAVGRCERRIGPIWFSLVAAADQEGSAALPQLSASYLRIKDGNLPVSFIQKYLVKKLDLINESEVEITCRGRPVGPAMLLHSLIDQWFRAGPSHRTQASVGSSAKDFVMVLAYRRRAPAP